MKKSIQYLLILLLLALTACGRVAPAATPMPTPDTQATVDAAIVATATAQAGLQATVDTAVQATATAQAGPQATATTGAGQADLQITIDAAVQATVDAQATLATSTPEIAYVTLTEEELAAMIDQAAAEAATATSACAGSATQASADGTVTPEEAVTIQVYLVDAEQAIAYAEELVTTYYGLYGELASETLVLLQAIESDLAAMAQNTAAIAAALNEINATLAQGLTLAEESIAQLQAAAQAANQQVVQAQAQREAWRQALQTEIEARATTALAVPPSQIATDRAEALRSAFDYLDAVRAALADDALSSAELADITQRGANARASLEAQGGPRLNQAPATIDQVTAQLARGQVPQAQANLGTLEGMLGDRPRRSED